MANCRDVYTAIGIVESDCDDSAVGDGGKAVGRYQIWPCYVRDVNRILGYEAYTLCDRRDHEKALRMVRVYTDHYGRRYTRLTGREATAEILARIHNGGPNGFGKRCTIKYWEKVRKEMQK